MTWRLADNPATRWWDEVTARPDPIDAEAPWRIGPRDWGRIVARAVRGANADDYGIVASSIAFAAFLSLLPLLGLVALAYSAIVPRETVMSNIAALVQVLPGDASGFVRRWLVHSLARRDSHGIALIVSAALTLFSGRRVGRSLMRGINIASGIAQDRGPLATQGVALAIVLAGFGLMLAALVSISGLAIVQHLIPRGVPAIASACHALLWASLTGGPALALILTYHYAPALTPIGWRWAVPGTIVAVTLWLIATLAFGAYVGRFASYDTTYGSLSAVVVLLLWLMLSAWIFLFGAKLNAEALTLVDAGAPGERGCGGGSDTAR